MPNTTATATALATIIRHATVFFGPAIETGTIGRDDFTTFAYGDRRIGIRSNAKAVIVQTFAPGHRIPGTVAEICGPHHGAEKGIADAFKYFRLIKGIA